MWITALTALISPVSDFFTTRSKVKAAVIERKDELKKLSLTAKLESIKKAESTDLDIDSKNGSDPIAWANDVTLIIFLVPFMLSFYPPALPHIIAGFAALEGMPTWYKYTLGMMLVSVWGYRNLVAPIIKSVASAYLTRYKK